MSKQLSFQIVRDIPTLGHIYKHISNLNQYYPNFNQWYFNKFIPDTVLNTAKAIILLKQNQLIGVSLLKDTPTEKKLRCLRILPQYQSKGYVLYLIDKSLKILNTDKPHCTVAEELFHQYSRIFINRYSFNLTKVEKNLYRKNKLEYLFN